MPELTARAVAAATTSCCPLAMAVAIAWAAAWMSLLARAPACTRKEGGQSMDSQCARE